ncbi:hypothetical protein ABT040_25280 [Streptomyces sp. NPDC002688]|uniref:hypothetical protein n=1 Tax=Streptomyces sp. NPDC002688 TaxID=3154423 RepID=UPI003320648D
MTLSWEVVPLARLGAGYLLTRLGPVGSVWVLAAVALATAVAATVGPSARNAPPLPASGDRARPHWQPLLDLARLGGGSTACVDNSPVP